jgi:hypothetical protein
MAERRGARTKRRTDDDELADMADDVLAEEPDDESAEEPDDEPVDEVDEPDEEAEEEEPEEEEEDADDGGDRRRRPGRRSGGLSAGKAGQAALRQIAELTGKSPEGVHGVEPSEDGWTVGVDIVEDRRIPSSTDILATYEIDIDSDGELVSYRRVRRYQRGRGDDEDS